MTVIGPPPTEWKSARWWQNRTPEERTAWASLPSRWSSIALSDVNVSEKSLSKVRSWIDSYTAGVSGLYITGPSAGGKTILAQAVLKELFQCHLVSGRFVSSERYVEMLKDQFDNDNELPEMYAIPHLVKYLQGLFDVVVLDGVGQERSTEFSQHEIGSLLRRRYEDGRTTIVTTALSLPDFVRRYGQRVAAVTEELLPVAVS
jgi:DNA replication protein DnaC